MPTVLTVGPNRFFFYSLEYGEPAHIHVEQRDSVAKFWLDPVALAASHGFRAHEINRLRELVMAHRESLIGAWNEHFSDQA